VSGRPSIRNFSIIAHVDHGKSTLADQLMAKTGTVSARDAKPQLLDSLAVERERGITVKLAPVRMRWHGVEMNLIDTPGHADFAYEVSRALAAVEGALVLVDASQGVQAQTLAHLHVAEALHLTLLPVVTKVDLPNADVAAAVHELAQLLHCAPDAVRTVSGKTGEGITELLDTILEKIPPPVADPTKPARGLIVDSRFDAYRGVVATVRVISGAFAARDRARLANVQRETELMEVGAFGPALVATPELSAGEIGYVVSGIKRLTEVRVGDTLLGAGAVEALPGYRKVQPLVFASFFPAKEGDVGHLRDALERLTLNDASVTVEPEHSDAFGAGFRCGFLGLLHLDIVRQRLVQEFAADVTVSAPSVEYRMSRTDGSEASIRSAAELPDPSRVRTLAEPWVRVTFLVPPERLGAVLQLVRERRGAVGSTETLDRRVVIESEMPLAGVILNLADRLKSATAGYGSLQYAWLGFRPFAGVRLDILVAGEPVPALAQILEQNEAYRRARAIVDTLAKVLPKQLYEQKVQGAVGGRILASASVPALRKDVTAKLYGGDVTRKRKLLDKQKRGKKRLAAHGRTEIPEAVFRAILAAAGE
jgi:GTP-binding protein LepA